MTMQIAIRASDGFVLASDISVRTTDCFGSPGIEGASFPRSESKTRINGKHAIAFALAGTEPSVVNALDDLDAALTATETLPPDYAKWMEEWERAYAANYPSMKVAFLIVNPSADADHILDLLVEYENCRAVPDLRWTLHPDPTNPSNFWPQYCRAQGRPPVELATRIAALTVLMAGELSPQSISELEIARFQGGNVDAPTRRGNRHIGT